MLLVAACLVPTTAAAAIVLWASFQEGRRALVIQAQASARATSRSVDTLLAHAISGLNSLATAPPLASGDLHFFRTRALQVLPFRNGNNIVLSDLDGQQLVNTLVPEGEPLPRHGNLEFQGKVIRTGEPGVSDLFIGGALHRGLVAVEVPVWIDHRIAYTLAMGFLPERIGALLALQHPDPQWIVSIFDSTGTIVARTHEAAQFVGQKGAPALLSAIALADEGALELDTLEGVPVYAAYARSAATGWTIAIGVPRTILLARLYRWTAWMATLMVVLVVIGVLVARLVSVRIAREFSALISPAMALGAGTPVMVPALNIKEADRLGQAIADASALLRARTLERDEASQRALASQRGAHEMRHAAHHDSLTGLPNRRSLVDVLAERLRRCDEEGTSLTLLFVDMDDFKQVNDTHGHAAGDELLEAFAKRLRASVRSGDFVARIGGDEFAVIVDGQSSEEARPLAAHLVDQLGRPYEIGGRVIRVSASVGAADFPTHATAAQALLQAADAAMYASKRSGKGQFTISGPVPL